MKAEKIARAVATEVGGRPPQEWLDAPNWMDQEEAWALDGSRVVTTLLLRDENLYLAIQALQGSVLDQSRRYAEASVEELADALSSLDWWELHSAGILDGHDFRVWSFKHEDNRLHFSVAQKLDSVAILQFSAHLAR